MSESFAGFDRVDEAEAGFIPGRLDKIGQTMDAAVSARAVPGGLA